MRRGDPARTGLIEAFLLHIMQHVHQRAVMRTNETEPAAAAVRTLVGKKLKLPTVLIETWLMVS